MNRHGKIAANQARVSVQLTKQEVAVLRKLASVQKRSLSNYLSVLASAAIEQERKKGA